MGEQTREKPVMYLDVDDTLLTYSTAAFMEKHDGRPPLIVSPDDVIAGRGARQFVLWALEHFEVRWLTAWCPSGTMGAKGLDRLSRALFVPADQLASIHNPRPWSEEKTEGIDWTEHRAGRPWVWVEDGLWDSEIRTLRELAVEDRFIRCNVTEDADAIRKTHALLRARFTPTESVVTHV